MSSKPHPSYRPDIDGLRALAVLPVLLYHAHVPGSGGGFVGVDIFFVISGYLITGIIAREIDAGDFSIINFYERRARRILPALFAVIAFVLIAASWLYLPGDFEGVPRSALAALGFLANIWLFMEAGYFQAAAETMPLLHTWSLGVEEQFYIIFPVILIAIARIAPAWRLRAVAALAAGSFVWAVAKQADTDSFAFYLLPPRAWELMIGSLLALGVVPAIRCRWINETLCLAALIAIIGPVIFYSSQTVFPGTAALPPVLGAAILIHCARGTFAGALLSMRGPVAIGLISYSLYLWHWPLIVFTQYAQDAPLSAVQSVLIITVSLAISWASWRFIERPFRNRAHFDRKRIFMLSGSGIAALSALCAVMIAQGGWASRFPEQTVRYANGALDISPARSACITDEISGHWPDCTLGADTPPSAVIWGDSHGMEMAWVLGQTYAVRGASIAQRTRASCAPALGYDDARDPKCRLFNEAVLAEIEASRSVQTVYLTAFWAREGYRDAAVDQLVDDTITRLQSAGKAVILIGPVPPQPASVPRRLALRGANAQTASRAEFEAQTDWFTGRFAKWRARGVNIIEPARVLVRGDTTIIVEDGQPLYFDSHHLSLTGAKRVLAQDPAQ
ncbi:acyltransferase family protein [Pontixanthobacter sp.]|uniref:acyltransferase family protein n=1 Tax=Pontixanthobacter sp. TaxID=2792078 RepID=UPI003C7DF35E